MSKLQIFGDSILKGVTYSEEANRYKLTANRKLDALTEKGIEVENHSKMGATVDHILKFEERFINAGNGADSDNIVLLGFGGNDCDYNWAQVSECPTGEHSPKTDPERFAALYEQAIDNAEQSGARVAVASLVPIDADKYMKWISRGLARENILSWLGDVSMLSRWHEYYNRMVVDIAARRGCILIDLRDAFLRRHDFRELICSDGIHPTNRGYEIIDSVITERLSAVVPA